MIADDVVFTEELWQRSLNVYSEMKKAGIQVAAPFVGFRPKGFPGLKKSVLYVGKATKSPCEVEKFDAALEVSAEDAFEQSASFARTIFVHRAQSQKSGPSFWGFANELGSALGGTELSNVSWSNLARIGIWSGNPGDAGPLALELQTQFAIEILRREIEVLQPDLIVFVTNNYAKKTMLPAIGDPGDADWEKSELLGMGADDVWWRERTGSVPAILWMRHPQGCPVEKRDFAIQKARELTA